MTDLASGRYCFKCGQDANSVLHTEQRLGSHAFEPSYSLQTIREEFAPLFKEIYEHLSTLENKVKALTLTWGKKQ